MSKLSESVKHMQEADAKKNIDFWFNSEDKRQEFLNVFYDKLLNLEFDSLKSTNDFYNKRAEKNVWSLAKHMNLLKISCILKNVAK